MTNNELLLAIADIMDQKLDTKLTPIEDNIHDMQGDIQDMKGDIHNLKLTQENIILPRLNTIESCYTSTYNRYKSYADKMDAAFYKHFYWLA